MAKQARIQQVSLNPIQMQSQQERVLVSIVVTIYNSADTLRTCLESLKGQTLKQLQVLLVNDCSDDPRNKKICQEFCAKDPRFLYIEHETNKGTAQARKTGVEASSGYYIGFLDSDDFAISTCFEKLVREIKAHDADIAVANYSTFNDDAQIVGIDNQCGLVESCPVFTLRSDIFFARQLERIPHPFYFRIDWWNKIYKRELFDSELFSFPHASRNEGSSSLMMSLVSQKVVCINAPLFFTRTAAASLSRSFSIGKVEDCIKTSLHFRRFLVKSGNFDRFYDLYLRVFMYIVLELNVSKACSSNLSDEEKASVVGSIFRRAFESKVLRRDVLLYLQKFGKRSLIRSINFMRTNPSLALSEALSAARLDYYPERTLLLKPYKYRQLKIASNKPTVSIVTITKDLIGSGRLEVFQEMILSLRGQTIGDKRIEHIVIDAASKDGTLDVLRSYYSEKSLFDVVLSEPDTGVYNAMNKGLKLAGGDYFLFLNSDDYLASNALELLINACESNNADYAYADAFKINIKGDKVGTHIGNESKAWFGAPYCHQTLLCRTSTCRDLEFDETYRITMMKYAFELYLSKRAGIYVPDKLAYFRIGGLSTNDSFSQKMRDEQLRCKQILSKKLGLEVDRYLFIERAIRARQASELDRVCQLIDQYEQAQVSWRDGQRLFVKDVKRLVAGIV